MYTKRLEEVIGTVGSLHLRYAAEKAIVHSLFLPNVFLNVSGYSTRQKIFLLIAIETLRYVTRLSDITFGGE